MTVFNGFFVLKGETHPMAQQASTHGGSRLVNDINQGNPTNGSRVEQFQVTCSKTINANIGIVRNFLQAIDMFELGVLCFREVVQDRPGANNAFYIVFQTKAFEVFGLEVLGQTIFSKGILKYPIFLKKRIQFSAKMGLKLTF